ncbi:MAG: hypothetical protein ABJF01_19830 [bacterium]
MIDFSGTVTGKDGFESAMAITASGLSPDTLAEVFEEVLAEFGDAAGG